MVEGVVYMYTSPIGKSYIGQTTNETARRKKWYSSSYKYAGDKVNRARAKYGPNNFTYKRLYNYIFPSRKVAVKVLDIFEEIFIVIYNTIKDGYNIDKGGHNKAAYNFAKHHKKGYKLSRRTRLRIGLASRRRWENPEYKKAAVVALRKNRVYKKGYRNYSHAKPIVQLSLDGKYINEFPSQREAEAFILGKEFEGRTNIGPVCNGKRDSAEGFKWLFKDDYYNYFLHPEKPNIPQRVIRAFNDIKNRNTPRIKSVKEKKERKSRLFRNGRIIGQYDLTFHLVKIWYSINYASETLHICQRNIRRAIKTLGKYKGFYWRDYEGLDTVKPKVKKKKDASYTWKAVVQKDINDNVINIYQSITEACKVMHKNNKTMLSRCLNGKIKTAYGFKWEFLKGA